MNDKIVACARGWLGTRFVHQGRLKKGASHTGGVDCLGLLVGIAAELELLDANKQQISTWDEFDYPHYPDCERLKQRLGMVMQNIPTEGISAGDVLLLSVDGRAQHLAIVADGTQELHMIHAYAPAHKVVEHVLDGWWRARIEAAYRIL